MLYTQLRAFHAVACEGGFTRASKTLHVGQPTLTSQVKALEETYDVELLLRYHRRTVLTEAGKQLFAVTSRLFDQEKEARELLKEAGALTRGHLKVAAVGPSHLVDMLGAFHSLYPGIHVSVYLGNSDDVLGRLLNYSADIGVLAHWTNDARFFHKRYGVNPVVAFVNSQHPWAQRKRIRIAEIDGQDMVSREPGSVTRRTFETALAGTDVQPNVVMEIGSREGIRDAVIKGIGFGVVAETEYIHDPCLSIVRIEDAEMYTYTSVACLAERQNGRLIRAFLDVVETLLV